MTKYDMETIMYALERCKENERELCRNYVKLNPHNERQRQLDRDFIICGIDTAWNTIHTLYKEKIFEKEPKKSA